MYRAVKKISEILEKYQTINGNICTTVFKYDMCFANCLFRLCVLTGIPLLAMQFQRVVMSGRTLHLRIPVANYQSTFQPKTVSNILILSVHTLTGWMQCPY